MLKKVDIKQSKKVIITFLDTGREEAQGIYKLAEMGGSFDFLDAPEENIYSDNDLKVKYRKWLTE